MVKSSLPFSSPLMTTDLPMFTLSLSRNWLASARGLGVATVGGWGVGAAAGCPLGGCPAWSRFHMGSSACLRCEGAKLPDLSAAEVASIGERSRSVYSFRYRYLAAT